MALIATTSHPRSVSLAEAKAKLSALVDAAEAGETIIITRHGHRVAKLSPVVERARTPREAVDAWLAYRDAHPLKAPDDFDPYDRSTLGHPR